VLHVQKYVPNFGLPNATDEMNLGALLFAIQTYSGPERAPVVATLDICVRFTVIGSVVEDGDNGTAVTGLTEYDMGENILYFHKHSDEALALQTVGDVYACGIPDLHPVTGSVCKKRARQRDRKVSNICAFLQLIPCHVHIRVPGC
jgi:hypothetical protein